MHDPPQGVRIGAGWRASECRQTAASKRRRRSFADREDSSPGTFASAFDRVAPRPHGAAQIGRPQAASVQFSSDSPEAVSEDAGQISA